ncbi:sensor histidine kinase [Lysobacter enzymogenes]|uniref:sensor histidine kinase n=1 Tax=Lysobacter enzymogenes TaxID=69 RepID=UPI001A962F12|nr:histidine kinase [Lysobacter enzymogenes]QQP94960.1 histidine kinase [Lysobacter enzymogenes]
MQIQLGDTTLGLRRYLALWSVVAVAFAVQHMLFDAVAGPEVWPPWVYLRWSAIQWFTWAALAPWIFKLSARHPVRPPLHLRGLARQALLSVGVTALALSIGAAVSTLFEPSGFGEQMVYFVGQHAATGLLTYWALLAIQHSLHFRAEQSRRELEAVRLARELAQSRLQVLKTQLQPHFLFNTLHAIVTLLDEDQRSAEDMLLRLSELLRAFLEDYDGQEISLRRELDLLELYLGIQRKRFQDRLEARIYADPEALDCAVPSLLLQPLVENAIRHGIGRRVGADRVEIECRREDGELRIEVRNRNSELTPGESPQGHGIGLSNTRLRLRELYGDAAQLRLDQLWPQGVACRIALPAREIDEDVEVAADAPAPDADRAGAGRA